MTIRELIKEISSMLIAASVCFFGYSMMAIISVVDWSLRNILIVVAAGIVGNLIYKFGLRLWFKD